MFLPRPTPVALPGPAPSPTLACPLPNASTASPLVVAARATKGPLWLYAWFGSLATIQRKAVEGRLRGELHFFWGSAYTTTHLLPHCVHLHHTVCRSIECWFLYARAYRCRHQRARASSD